MTKAKVKKPKARVYSNYLKEDAFIVEMRSTTEIVNVFLNDDGNRITNEWTPFRRDDYFEMSVLDLLEYDARSYAASSALPYATAMCVAWGIKASKQGYFIDVRVRPCEINHSLSLTQKGKTEAVHL